MTEGHGVTVVLVFLVEKIPFLLSHKCRVLVFRVSHDVWLVFFSYQIYLDSAFRPFAISEEKT